MPSNGVEEIVLAYRHCSIELCNFAENNFITLKLCYVKLHFLCIVN